MSKNERNINNKSEEKRKSIGFCFALVGQGKNTHLTSRRRWRR